MVTDDPREPREGTCVRFDEFEPDFAALPSTHQSAIIRCILQDYRALEAAGAWGQAFDPTTWYAPRWLLISFFADGALTSEHVRSSECVAQIEGQGL